MNRYLRTYGGTISAGASEIPRNIIASWDCPGADRIAAGPKRPALPG